MTNTEFLYHYTSIETLALILKNRTIRFNSLDKMDDLQEKETADIKNIGKFCYISSWSDNSVESIPMWREYASINQGVRLKLKKNPFKIYRISQDEIDFLTKHSLIFSNDLMASGTLIPISTMSKNKFTSLNAIYKNILIKIEYTDDDTKLYPKLFIKNPENPNRFTICMNKLGICKNTHWSYQNEWRYMFLIMPFNAFSTNNSEDEFNIVANQMRLGIAQQPFDHFDLSIDDDAFNSMEITMSPKISNGNRIVVQSLVEKYNNSAKLIESELYGLI